MILQLPNLRPGVTERSDCPACGGKHTFTVTNTGTEYLYNCYRASCGIKGRQQAKITLDGLIMRSDVKHAKMPEDKPVDVSLFTPAITNPTCWEMLNLYNSRYAVEQGLINTWHDTAKNRLVFGICNPDYITYSGDMKYVVDYIGRLLGCSNLHQPNFGGGIRPKWKRYGRTLHPFVCPDIRRNYDTIVVVEDCFSACAVCELAAGVALLGTTLHQQHINDITKLQPKEVIVCLDHDAQHKALDMAVKLRYYVPKIRIVDPPKDLKHFKTDELKGILQL